MKPIFSAKEFLGGLLFIILAGFSATAFPQNLADMFDIGANLNLYEQLDGADNPRKPYLVISNWYVTDTDTESLTYGETIFNPLYAAGFTNLSAPRDSNYDDGFPRAVFQIDTDLTYSQPITPGNDNSNYRFWVVKTGAGTLTLNASVPSSDPNRIFRNNRTNLEITEGTVILAMPQDGAQGDDFLFDQVVGVASGATLQIGGTRTRQILSNVFNMNGTFDLNGYSQEIDQLHGNGKIINRGGGQSVLYQRGGNTFSGSLGVNPTSTEYDDYINAGYANINNIQYVKTGGDSTLNVTNYHTGGTQINGGRLNVYAMSALGAGGLSFNGGYLGVRGTNGQTLYLLTQEAFENPSDGVTYTPTNSVVMNEINIGSNGAGFNLRDYIASCDVHSKLTGAGGLMLSFESGYALTLFNPNNDYRGDTYIGTTGYMWGDDKALAVLRLGADNVLPDTTNVVFGYYLRNAGAANELVLPAVLDLNGKSDTVKGLTGTGTIRNNTSDNSVLKIHANAGEISTFGSITTEATGTGTLALQKTGEGEMIFDRRTVPLNQPLEVLEGNLRTTSPYSILPGDTFHITGDPGNVGLIVDASGIWGHYVLPGGSNREVRSSTDYLHNVSPYLDVAYPNDQNAYWPYETTQVFTSVISIAEDVTLDFFKNFDDRAWVTLTKINPDGTLGAATVVVDGGGSWGDWHVAADKFFEAGDYLLEIRPGQGGGGAGTTGTNDLGFGIRRSGDTSSTHPTGFYYLQFDADGNIQIDEGAPIISSPNQTIAADFIIDAGKTFTVSGLGSGAVNLTGDFSGDGILRLDGSGAPLTIYDTITAKTSITGSVSLGESAVLKLVSDDSLPPGFLDLNGFSLQMKPADGTLSVTFDGTISGPGTLVFDVRGLTGYDDIDTGLGASADPFYQIGVLDIDGLDFAFLYDNLDSMLDKWFYLLDTGEYTNDGVPVLNIEDCLANLFGYESGAGLWFYETRDNGIWISPNDQAVPEPATWAMMFLAVGGVLWMRTRRRA